MVDYLRYFGKWQKVYHIDFTRPDPEMDGLEFSRLQLTVDELNPKPGIHGLHLEDGELMWLRNVRHRGSIRLEAVVQWPDRVDGLEMFINSRREQGKSFAQSPTGYSCQFDGWQGTANAISRNPEPQFTGQGGSIGADFEPGKVYRLWFQRVGEELSLWVDRRKILDVIEPIPLAGDSLLWAAVRSWGAADIHSVTVWRMGAPLKTSPPGRHAAAACHAQPKPHTFAGTAQGHSAQVAAHRAQPIGPRRAAASGRNAAGETQSGPLRSEQPGCTRGYANR